MYREEFRRFPLRRIKAITHGLEAIHSREPQIWATAPQFNKDPMPVTDVKNEIESFQEKPNRRSY